LTTRPGSTASINQSRLWIWYLQCVLHDFVLIFPTYAIMMQDTGITPAGFGSLLAIWSGTMLLFEVPSGVIGDLFPRKLVLIASGVIRSAAFATWLIWPTYWGFALGFVIWSLGSSFHSGTSEAFLYESTEHKPDFERVYGRSEAAYGIGAAAALFLGGYVAEGGYDLPLTLSVLAPLAAALVIATGLKNTTKRAAADDMTFWRLFRSGFGTVLTVRVLGLLITMSAVLAAIPGILEEYLGVLLDESGFTLTAVGVTYGLVWLGRTVGSLLAHRLQSPSLVRLTFLPICAALVYLAGMTGSALVFAGGFIVYFALFGAFDVLLGARLQREVRDDHRATVTSVASMTLEGAAIVYALTIGALAEWLGWSTAFLTSNIAGLAFALAFLARARRLGRHDGHEGAR
jgi:MFS family permease